MIKDYLAAGGFVVSLQNCINEETIASIWLCLHGEPTWSYLYRNMQDPVLGPPVMQQLHASIRGCPPPMQVADAGHFVQERGEAVARRAVTDLA